MVQGARWTLLPLPCFTPHTTLTKPNSSYGKSHYFQPQLFQPRRKSSTNNIQTKKTCEPITAWQLVRPTDIANIDQMSVNESLPHRALRQQIIDTCKAMQIVGINQGTSGNVSARVEEGMYITPSGVCMILFCKLVLVHSLHFDSIIAL